jgi:hypothetical protein
VIDLTLRAVNLARGVGEIGHEERLDELYREPPEGFVAARNELARELRASGDRDESNRIKKLRRPSVAAWLLNRTALSLPRSLDEFAEACRRLEEAQGRALEGDDDAVAEWRAAAAGQRASNAAVVETAAGLARDAGHSVNRHVLDLVSDTLQAASGDADLRDRLMRGRLEREESAPTLGMPTVAPQRRRDSRAAERRDLTRARQELERLREELDRAADRAERLRESVERTTETLREERARLAAAKREAASLRRRMKAAERKAAE